MLNCLGSLGWRIAQCPDPETKAVGTCDASSGAGFGTISARKSSAQDLRNMSCTLHAREAGKCVTIRTDLDFLFSQGDPFDYFCS